MFWADPASTGGVAAADQAERAIVLRGNLAAVLRFAANKKNPDVLSVAGVWGALLSQELLVAGIGFEPMTFRL
ncbi:hypothetical protein [Bradyrhizobium tunisiense]|uniref:hypothetical protein n=1 Tax=Bradyrhizobium tunisiense TaxID=3278709 RepID=UPI0035E084BE